MVDLGYIAVAAVVCCLVLPFLHAWAWCLADLRRDTALEPAARSRWLGMLILISVVAIPMYVSSGPGESAGIQGCCGGRGSGDRRAVVCLTCTSGRTSADARHPLLKVLRTLFATHVQSLTRYPVSRGSPLITSRACGAACRPSATPSRGRPRPRGRRAPRASSWQAYLLEVLDSVPRTEMLAVQPVLLSCRRMADPIGEALGPARTKVAGALFASAVPWLPPFTGTNLQPLSPTLAPAWQERRWPRNRSSARYAIVSILAAPISGTSNPRRAPQSRHPGRRHVTRFG